MTNQLELGVTALKAARSWRSRDRLAAGFSAFPASCDRIHFCYYQSVIIDGRLAKIQ